MVLREVLRTIVLLCVSCLGGQVYALEVELCRWKGNAEFAFSIIHDDFGDGNYTPEILKAGTMAHERGLRIASAAVVKRMVDGGTDRWNAMNDFIAQGHEIVNHSWNHDNPTSGSWDDFRDMSQSKDSLEAHLADSVWQKAISFFCFPEDAGTAAQLDSLKLYGYVGARWREGYEGDRVNLSTAAYNPFRTDFYGYISKEYGDSVLATNPNSNYTDWWLTYPDKPYFNYKSPIERLEQRHLDKAQETGSWGVMEMHSLAPSQLYPEGSSWWSPMSYDKYAGLLDRCVALISCDSLWMDVPSAVSSYIVMKSKTSVLVEGDSIRFDYSAVDAPYRCELSLLVHTGAVSYRFTQGDEPIAGKEINDSTVCITIDPQKGNIKVSPETGTLQSDFQHRETLRLLSDKAGLKVYLPAGAYELMLFDLRGRSVGTVTGISTGRSAVSLGAYCAAGTYLMVATVAGNTIMQRLVIGE